MRVPDCSSSSTARESTRALMSGFVFSALSFHHVNSGSDSEGFLLGDVKGEAKDCITDSQMSNVEVVYTIDIQRHIPCYRLFSFYSGTGEIDEAALENLLCGQGKNVVGWYKFRENTSRSLTFRERLLHKNLQSYLSNPGLVFLLITSHSTTRTDSTYRIEYALHTTEAGIFQKLPLIIANLGMSDQQEYKTSGSCVSLGFDKAIKNHSLDFFHEDGNLKEVGKITAMCSSLQEELEATCSRVVESESYVEKLLQEVNQLKKQVAEKKTLCKNEEAKPTSPEENAPLCQALHHFLPNSALLQSSRLTLNGKVIPHSCPGNHEHNDVNKLILKIEECDLPDVSNKRPGKQKLLQRKRPSSPLMHTRSWTQQASSYDDRGLLNAGTETEDDLQFVQMDCSGSQSPTF
ncbi:BRCA1-A complex subunit Abraxas 1 [Hyperolius riggenbachi]|uniref:BRCA1-A complex subunit Abraxas 1 n=1 Tax=Hyperolius riggenbachi TaxID=752182 RepID=UPI0035A3CDCD